MGVLRKIGIAIVLYLILGVVFTFLLLNDIVSIHDDNILIDFLYTVLQPVIIVTNFLYVTLPFVP
ncbi:hypothetical protein EU528_08975 [Candidatus Thorarchaeota archaeon]|nr:MAG: hypothetical protein EU528_08975 [Candidatus Thorarchaeota archaeon]